MIRSKFVSKAEDIPTTEHWAIIEGTSVHIPGDERSRTNPGHGYPEHTENYISYEAFTDFAEFEAVLKKRLAEKFRTKSVRGIHVSGVYEATTEIHLKEK